MKNIKIEVTLEELQLLNSLMSDQLFRREFIDPKMPGYKRDPAELAAGKELGRRLKALAQELSGTAPRNGSSHHSPTPHVSRTAV